MLSMIIGGSASGKSEYAEKRCVVLGEHRIYLATMQPYDDECHARIAKHRRNRADRGFETIERYTDLAHLDVPENGNLLLECMSNLLANEMFSPDGGGAEAVIAGIESLSGRCAHLTVVTNEVFSGGTDYDEGTLEYMRALAYINRSIASKADFVAELLSGCPNILKGEEL